MAGEATRAEMLTGAVGPVELAGPSFGHLTCCVGIFDSIARISKFPPKTSTAGRTKLCTANASNGLLALSVAHPAGRRTLGSPGTSAGPARAGLCPTWPPGAYVAARVVSRVAIDTDGERRCAKAPSP